MKRTPENIEQFQLKQLEGTGQNSHRKVNKLADALKDDNLMTFGKHKGVKLGDVPDSYLLWLYAYIYNCYEALEK